MGLKLLVELEKIASIQILDTHWVGRKTRKELLVKFVLKIYRLDILKGISTLISKEYLL